MKSIFLTFSIITVVIFSLGVAFAPVPVFAQSTQADEQERIAELHALVSQLLLMVIELQQQLLVAMQAQALAAGPACGQAEISWEKVSGVRDYVLYRNDIEVYSGRDLKFTDTGLAPSTLYAYTIRTRNAGGLSPASLVQTITTSSQCPPSAPSIFAQAGVCGGAIRVSWNRAHDATFYEVFRGKARVFGGNTISFTDRGLRAERDYTYKVRAGNAGGLGEFSQEIEATASAVCPPLAPNAPKVGTPFLDESAAQEGILTFEIRGGSSGTKIRPERSGTVLSFVAKAKLSPIIIERVDVEFSDRPWLFLSDIAIRGGSGNTISIKPDEDAFTRIDGTSWRVRFSGLAIEVQEGRSRTISVRVTAKENKNLIDSREIDVSIPMGSVRGRDEIGVAHFGPSTNTFVKTFFVEKE